MEFEIYVRDLKPEIQKSVLKFLGLKNEEEGNLDTFPLTLIPKPED